MKTRKDLSCFPKIVAMVGLAAISIQANDQNYKTPRMPRSSKFLEDQKPTVRQLRFEERNKRVRSDVEDAGPTKKRPRWRMAKRSEVTFEVKKTLSTMTYSELNEKKNKLMAEKDYDTALKYLDRLIKVCDDPYRIALHMIEFADLLYTLEKFEKAGLIYREFNKLYPGHRKTEHCMYRAIKCSTQQMHIPERDQTPTEDTLKLCESFLARESVTEALKKEVHEIQKQCYQSVIQSELNIANFYLTQSNYKAVAQRAEHIRGELIAKLPEMEADLVALEYDLAVQYPEFTPPTEKPSVKVDAQKTVLAKNKRSFADIF